MSRLRRAWARRHDPINLTLWKSVVAGLLISASVSAAFLVAVEGIVRLADETRERTAADRRSQADIERIVKRVVRVERHRDLMRALERACRRFESCAAELDRAERQERAETRRRQRRDREDRDRAPDQRADRPPRPVATPAPQPEPIAGGPPEPPSTAAPSSPLPPRAPDAPPREPGVRVDPPAVDLDGLLPDLLPRVDVPPVRLP